MTNLGKLFDAGTIGNSIVAKVDEALDVLNQPVSAGAYDVKSLSLDAGTPTLNVFDAPVQLGATLKLAARIAGKDETFNPFGEAPFKAADGTSYASLQLDAQLTAGTKGGGKSGVLTISGEASASAKMSYLHLLPVAGTTSRLDALVALARTTELPQLATFDKLENGEVLQFDAMLSVDLGIQAQYGADLTINETLAIAGDLALPVQAHVGFTAQASLGFSLYEEVSVTVAKAGQRQDGWVRIRFTRKHSNSITFGAALALAVQYDAETGANMLLDKTFANLQMPKLVADIKEVADFATQPWDTIKTQLSAKAADAVVALVGDTGWKQWLDNDPRVKQLLDATNWIVNTYDKLDAKVKSIWDELLARISKSGFGVALQRIHQLATLDVNSIDLKALADGKLDDIIELVELLSGKDIEELVVSGKIKEGLEQAVALAKKIDDAISSAPDKAVEFVRGYAQRTGIKAAVDWLRQNGTTTEGLKSAGDTWIRNVVERLTGKTLDRIDAGDVARLQAFAAKVDNLIATPEKLKAKLQNAFKKLKGDFTVSLSIEISRVSEWAAVVDLEIDPTNKEVATAANRFLPSGNVQDLLKALDNAPNSAFDIREMILTSRRLRTSTGILVFPFLGKITEQQKRIEEETLTYKAGAGATTQRSALYAGGNSYRRTEGSVTTEGAAFVQLEATSGSLNPDDKYDKVEASIRLTYVREDTDTRQEDLNSITAILADLGMSTEAINLADLGTQTRFSVELNLPATAIDALIKDIKKDDEWNVDMRNAGNRWFKEQGLNPGFVTAGNEMAQVIQSPKFAQTWESKNDFENAAQHNEFPVQLWDTTRHTLKTPYVALGSFLAARADRYGRYKNFAPLKTAKPVDDELAKATASAADLFSIPVLDQLEWKVPLLNFWMVLSRVSRIDQASLTKARGVATLRWRDNSNADWEGPKWFSLTEGTGVWPTLRNRAFPIT